MSNLTACLPRGVVQTKNQVDKGKQALANQQVGVDDCRLTKGHMHQGVVQPKRVVDGEGALVDNHNGAQLSDLPTSPPMGAPA